MDTVGSFKSSDTKYNFSELPTIISHISDVHIDHFTPERAINFEKSLNLSKKLGATSVVFTGDITTNFGHLESSVLAFGNQFLPDFEDYEKIIKNFDFGDMKMVDISGNHDQYGVYSYKNSNHYFINHSYYFNLTNTPELQNFWAGTFVMNGITYVYANPYEYPMAHAKLGFWINAGKKLLDAIEAEIKKPFNTTHRIFITHFPVHLWSDRYKSSSKKSFRQLITEGNFSLVLTGHLHPSKPTIKHHHSTLEIVAPDLMSHKCFGLIVNDNNLLTYHNIDLENPPKTLIISPPPKDQLHKNSNYIQRTKVRLLAFTNDELNIQTNFQDRLIRGPQVTDGIWLYESQYEVPDSEDSYLELSGDVNDSVFYFLSDDQDVKIGNEKIYGYPNLISTGIALLFLGLIANIIFLLPIPISISTKLYEEYICGHNGSISFSAVVLNTIFGIIPLMYRLRRIPLKIKLYLAFLIVCPAFLPLFFMSVGGHFGAVFCWGYVVSGVYHFDIYGAIFIAVYYAVILTLISMAAGELIIRGILFRIIATIYILVSIGVGLFMAFNLGILTAGLAGALTSPIFVFVPIISLIILSFVSYERSYDLYL
ncbi:calcineurin-like phosphoesterase family [Trichomonas vaginalis G3]|uniref:calcineurin-like phosphoesterase family n=1 Tax=Trichomonas vaginalis (strain ATCC PRA-98 / G3) TaxID=412133 RepID=UPI0021E55CB8|nr:calcineurin-like phosphoesterase family [Trichomonas vaginalis G3]KAI5511212.1 calcineurin-like phosphoesterase family [Trichomonas vaginalis G3]